MSEPSDKEMTPPPFLEHALKGAAFGGLVGGSIAAMGWMVRQRNSGTVDLGVDAPTLVGRHRSFAEELLPFREVAQRQPALQSLYEQIVDDCEYAVQNGGAKGGAQIAVQKRANRAVAGARKFSHEAFRCRDALAQDCKMQADVIQTHLNGVIKNMMMSSS